METETITERGDLIIRRAILSGGGAVSMYTGNECQSKDLDFVTSKRRDRLAEALAPLGFTLASDRRRFEHSNK